MRALRLFLCLEIAFLLLALAGVALGAEQPQGIIIENLTPQSEVIYDYSKGIGWGTNGVIIRYTNAVLTAHAAMVNIDSGEAQAEGDVTLQRQGEIWRGERLLSRPRCRNRSTGSSAAASRVRATTAETSASLSAPPFGAKCLRSCA